MKRASNAKISETEFSEKSAIDKAKFFTKNLASVLTINGEKVNKKDINYIYRNILYALLPQSKNS